MGSRGVISDKWSMRVLWVTAIGSAIGLYMVAVERQTQNREKLLAESLRAAAKADANNSGTLMDSLLHPSHWVENLFAAHEAWSRHKIS